MSNIRFSPDGQHLAYSRPPDERNPAEDVFLFSVSQNTETPLILHPAIDKVAGWAPDGKTLLFLSNRRGTMDLWAVGIHSGKAAGEPFLVRSTVGDVTGLRLAQSGALFYQVWSGGLGLYRATLDFGSGKLLTVLA